MFTHVKTACLGATFLAFFAPALTNAAIEMTFRDGAPKDLFVLSNTGACPTAPMTLSLDMTDSAGRVVFDITENGAGVEVFQPLEFVDGAQFLRAQPDVTDGQNTLVLELGSLPPAAQVRFTIDVDDTIGQREITVNGSELQGSVLTVLSGYNTDPGVFDESATARVATPACPS